MINNYKSIRNVRAEAGGAVDLGEPVSFYIAKDELKITGTNIIENGDFETGSVLPWVNVDMDSDTFGVSTDYATKTYSLRMTVDDSNDVAYVNFPTKVGSQYVCKFNRTIPNHDAGSSVKFGFGHSSDTDAYGQILSSDNLTTGRFREEIIFTATDSTSRLSVFEYGTHDDADLYIDDITCYEITDHSYKLMAVNDAIPGTAINTFAGEGAGAELSDLLSSDQETAMADSLAADNNSFDFQTSNSTIIGTDMFEATTATFANSLTKGKLTNSSGQAKVTLLLTTVVGRKYDVEFDVAAVSGVTVTVSLSADTDVDTGSQATGIGVSTDNNLNAPFTATATTSYLVIQNSDADGTDFVTLDDLKVYEVFGYDYYNAPAYKFGIVSNIWDQDSGGLITTAAAGDMLEVTVQGECTVITSSTNKDKDFLISRIATDGGIHQYAKTTDNALPNSVGVIREDVASSTNIPIILFQGVEFSESFVHKNSLQVHAKCDEAITKFRPVSLFLDSAGDLLCRHDDIPEEPPPGDTDYIGVDPGKWGIAELGGASGDIIPITVAGKTHFKTNSTMVAGRLIRQLKEGGVVSSATAHEKYLPNALGTIMGDHTISSATDIPITIFGGTPIGTITNWKRTIKVTAKANGAVTQYCPVALYLDQYGEYLCTSDDIPASQSSTSNAIWVDFRKWGIAQTTVADGEFVEIIVQGRTNVVDSKTSLERGDFVNQVEADGQGQGDSSTGRALTSLGMVEKKADGGKGVIIIF